MYPVSLVYCMCREACKDLCDTCGIYMRLLKTNGFGDMECLGPIEEHLESAENDLVELEASTNLSIPEYARSMPSRK